MSAKLCRIIDCYGRTPEQDKVSYVLLEDDKPTAWYTDAEVTAAILADRKPAKHWQVVTKDGDIHDFPEAATCQLGQAWGVGPWSYRLSDKNGKEVAEFPNDAVHYVRQV